MAAMTYKASARRVANGACRPLEMARRALGLMTFTPTNRTLHQNRNQVMRTIHLIATRRNRFQRL